MPIVLVWATLTLSVGVVLAVAVGFTIRAELARARKLRAFLEVKKLLRETQEARAKLYQLDLSDPKAVGPDQKKIIDQIVPPLNEIGLLVKKGYAAKEDVMGLAYPVFIRVWRLLEPYARYKEELEGNRWGRRLEWLAESAKDYHNRHPKHKNRNIFLYSETQSRKLLIHEPKTKAA